MADWQYTKSFVERSWQLPQVTPGRQVKAGFWIRETIDKALPSSVDRTGFQYPQEIYLRIPKDNIRAIVLHCGSHDDPVAVSFRFVDLEDDAVPPEFEALSYTWGSPTEQQLIEVCGHVVPIGLNLYQALKRLRSKSDDRVLWADALSISQIDLEEKTQQVLCMTKIYQKARRVLVWLGEETEHSAVGMQILGDLALGVRSDKDSLWQRLGPEVAAPGLLDIISRGYFDRLWVIQEVALAKSAQLICGSCTVSWHNKLDPVLRFVRAIKLAAISPQWSQHFENGTQRINLERFLQLLNRQLEFGPDAALWAGRAYRADLLSNAYDLRDRRVTDQRDKINALLGLVDLETAQKLQPDYSSSVEDTFARLIDVINDETRNLSLELAGTPSQNQQEHATRKSSADIHDTHHLSRATAVAQVEADCLQAIQQVKYGNAEHAAMLLKRATKILESGNS